MFALSRRGCTGTVCFLFLSLLLSDDLMENAEMLRDYYRRL
jgi:hypothetical protein